ncbi:hypothetical protein Tco_0349822, partial [Tanacetum coccineum]
NAEGRSLRQFGLRNFCENGTGPLEMYLKRYSKEHASTHSTHIHMAIECYTQCPIAKWNDISRLVKFDSQFLDMNPRSLL